MNFLHLIYAIGIFFVGSIVGVVIEYFVDIDILKDIQNENRKLRLENEQLKNREPVVERLEIVDSRKKPNDFEFGGF
jgi:predicted small secreted protein